VPLLPPWDQMSYFQPFQVASFALAVAPPQQIAVADPNRVLLVISGNAAVGNEITVSPDPSMLDGVGIILNPGMPRLVIDWATFGSLVNQAWYGTCGGGATTFVLSLSLKQWPTPQEGSLSG